jgi:peptidoglycan/xylan/chitin deacetylase (PgdA/CDA1 family)
MISPPITNQISLSPPSLWPRLQGKYQRGLASWFGRRDAQVSGSSPIVSFTFDDFPCSAVDVAARMLEECNLTATFYASLGLMGQTAPTGKIFDLDRLKALQTRGHELGCHTFDHCHAWNTQPAEFEASIIRNAETLAQLIPEAVFRSHAYPIALPRPGTKRRVGKYFACCRGGRQTFNLGRVDLNNLAAFFIEKSRHNLAVIRDLLTRNAQQRGWLIFATHDVCDNPTPYGCTPAVFEAVLQATIESGAKVLPVHSALRAVESRQR